MAPKENCQFCKIIYGMEEPRVETPVVSRFFLTIIPDESKNSLILFMKSHLDNPSAMQMTDEEKNDFIDMHAKIAEYLEKKFGNKLIEISLSWGINEYGHEYLRFTAAVEK